MSVDEHVPRGSRAKSLLVKCIPPLRYVSLQRRFLKNSGWSASVWAGVPIDQHRRPLPWYTYSAIYFLRTRLRPEMEVFEFGAGYSTLWWAAQVSAVCSVESDPAWCELLRPRLPGNTELSYEPPEIDGSYCRSALARGRSFDVAVIDGIDRNNCARCCIPALKEEGVIIWDNADWEHEYSDGLNHLASEGFRRIDFAGVGPLNGYGWSTAILYRPAANCLGI